jgi:subtilisin family serine protease
MDESVEDAVKTFGDIPGVISVQPNYYYRLLNTPNDPQFTVSAMYGMYKIAAPAAWDLTTGSSTVVVADIDTGLRYTHQDLAANTWTNPGEIQNNGVDDDGNGYVDDYYGYDFRYNDPDPLDEHGHGTHTAGTIGAIGNNALGVVGVNWNVKIMPIKIYSAGGTDSTSAMLINAYNYVRIMRERGVNIRVTNNSYGDCPESCAYDQATRDALEALGNAGVLNVFAAGNNGRNIDTGAPHFPSSYTLPTILAVASSTSTDARSSFSNYGTTSVDLAAPGSSILSTTRGTDSSYGGMSGTSMATPHVAGAAALLSAYNPGLSVASLKATLMNTADPVSWTATPTKTNGRLNVFNALQNQTVCTFELSATTISVRTKGGYYSVGMVAPANCDFAVKSNVNWIRVDDSGAGSGTGQVSFRVNVNPTITRSGTISVAGQTVTITQSRN